MPKEAKVGTPFRPYHPNVRAYDPKFRNLTAEIAKAAEEKVMASEYFTPQGNGYEKGTIPKLFSLRSLCPLR
jgi:hypothetical protein